MKTLPLLCLCLTLPLLAELPELKTEAAYGLGVASYIEEGRAFPIESDWSAYSGDLFLEGQGRLGSNYLFVNLRLTGTGTETEKWKGSGVLIQENDMSMVAIDGQVGLAFPRPAGTGTITPSIGLFAGLQSFLRENFIRFDDGIPIFGVRDEVTENVTRVGAGGGLALEWPVQENWVMGADTMVHWLFYTYAENNGFDTGIEGDGGLKLESALWLGYKLKNPGQEMGVKLGMDFQWIDGGDTGTDLDGGFVEWPDNGWGMFNLSLYWRGNF